MEIFGKKKKNTNPDEMTLGNLQVQIDELHEEIAKVASRADTETASIRNELTAILLRVSAIIDTLQYQSEKNIELDEAIAEIKAGIAENVITKKLHALLAEIDTVAAIRLEADEVAGKAISADSVETETLKADSVETDSVKTRVLEAESLIFETIETKISQSEDFKGDTAEIPLITTENIRSSKGYHQVGYGLSSYVERFRVELNDYFFLYSTDKNDQWSITWNGTMNYNNPLMTIRHILIENIEGKNYAYIDFYHPQTDLDFKALTFGELEPVTSFELIPIDEAYEEVNVGYWTSSSSESEKNFNVVFVEKLPEFGFTSYLYVTPERQSYVYSDGRFKPLTDDIFINEKKFTGLIWELQFKAAQIDVTDFSHKAFEGSLYSLKAVRKIEGFDDWSKEGLLWLNGGKVYYTETNPFLYTSIYALPDTVEENRELFEILEWKLVGDAEDFEYTVESLKVTNGVETAELLGFEAVDYFNTKMNTNIDQLNYEVCRLKAVVGELEDINLDFVRV